MRRVFVSGTLVLLFAALGAGIALTSHPDWTELAEASEPPEVESENSDSGEPTPGEDGGVAEAADTDSVVVPDAPPLLDRRLRVVSADWSLLAPVVMANETPALSHDEFAGAPLQVAVTHVRSQEALESALATGGAEESGADVAIVSLPSLAVAYERLRALEPRIILLAGWSSGAHALISSDTASLVRERRSPESPSVGTREASAELFMAAWLFERAGWDASELNVQALGGSNQMFRAVKVDGRPATGFRTITSTTEATALLPFVAVVPGAFATEHPRALAAFCSGYLGGADALHGDVPTAARSLAALPGTPETVDFVQQLGRIRFANVGENARRFALTGREVISLDWLFDETWRVWRSVGVVNSPTPASPLDPSVVTALVLRDPSRVEPAAAPEPRFDTDVVLAQHFDDLDDADLVAALGELVGVFERSALRLNVQRGSSRPDPDAVVRRSAERYGFDAARVQTGRRPPRGQQASIEVLAAP